MFPGHIAEADLPALYTGAEMFVWPSLYEGFGLPVLEAMACGTPVITSDVSSLPEVAGDSAILIPPRDIERLADAILRLHTEDDLREEYKQLGIKRAVEMSWENSMQALISVYREAMEIVWSRP